MAQVKSVGPSASQAHNAGSIPVIGSTKTELPQGNSSTSATARKSTVPYTAPNGSSEDSGANRTYRPSSDGAGCLPKRERQLPATTTRPLFLPPSATTVRDPDWVAEKLRHALDSEYPEALARKFLGDLSMWTTDADAVVTALTDRPSLPALDWDRRYSLPRQRTGDALIPPYMPSLSALISDWEHDDHLVVAQQWAAELGLSEIPEPGRGIRAWTGDHDGWYVEVWIISDRAAFDATVNTSPEFTADAMSDEL